MPSSFGRSDLHPASFDRHPKVVAVIPHCGPLSLELLPSSEFLFEHVFSNIDICTNGIVGNLGDVFRNSHPFVLLSSPSLDHPPNGGSQPNHAPVFPSWWPQRRRKLAALARVSVTPAVSPVQAQSPRVRLGIHAAADSAGAATGTPCLRSCL